MFELWFRKDYFFQFSFASEIEGRSIALCFVRMCSTSFLFPFQFFASYSIVPTYFRLFVSCSCLFFVFSISNSLHSFLDAVVAGRRPDLPSLDGGCPSEYKSLMRELWADSPDVRPTFTEAAYRLTAICTYSHHDYAAQYTNPIYPYLSSAKRYLPLVHPYLSLPH